MQDAPKTEKRKDSRGRVLRTGESQRPDGSYQFRWSEAGQRRTRYAPTLEELRQKEDEIARQRLLGRLSSGSAHGAATAIPSPTCSRMSCGAARQRTSR